MLDAGGDARTAGGGAVQQPAAGLRHVRGHGAHRAGPGAHGAARGRAGVSRPGRHPADHCSAAGVRCCSMAWHGMVRYGMPPPSPAPPRPAPPPTPAPPRPARLPAPPPATILGGVYGRGSGGVVAHGVVWYSTVMVGSRVASGGKRTSNCTIKDVVTFR